MVNNRCSATLIIGNESFTVDDTQDDRAKHQVMIKTLNYTKYKFTAVPEQLREFHIDTVCYSPTQQHHQPSPNPRSARGHPPIHSSHLMKIKTLNYTKYRFTTVPEQLRIFHIDTVCSTLPNSTPPPPPPPLGHLPTTNDD